MQMQSLYKPQSRISDALQKRKANGRLRQLNIYDLPVDFSSNDYLGLSRSAWIDSRIQQAAQHLPTGSTGSRLLNGNSPLYNETETFLAGHYEAEAALLYNSGYDANTGLLSTVIRPEDVVLYDAAIHASMHQGIVLSRAEAHAFPHNDVATLNSLLDKYSTGRITWILCESYYSMDGDQAPLKDFSELATLYNAYLIVDEAHAAGCFGPQGKGLCIDQGLGDKVFARVVTFGKGLGSHGAAVLCSNEVKQYLVNFSKSFIYTTALPPHSIVSIQAAHEFIRKFNKPQKKLQEHIQYFRKASEKIKGISGSGPVFSVIIPGEQQVRAAARLLQERQLDVRPIVAPTVPTGSERLRISLHSFNSKNEIDLLIYLLNGLENN